MVPKDKLALGEEQTEKLPAQEKLAYGDETFPTLTAEQVYAQRAAEISPDETVQNQGFIP